MLRARKSMNNSRLAVGIYVVVTCPLVMKISGQCLCVAEHIKKIGVCACQSQTEIKSFTYSIHIQFNDTVNLRYPGDVHNTMLYPFLQPAIGPHG